MNVRISKYSLTTEHAASSYGVPVLLVDGVPHGPCDLLPAGDLGLPAVTAAAALATLANTRRRPNDAPRGGNSFRNAVRHDLTDEQVAAIRLFCGSDPTGPQVEE